MHSNCGPGKGSVSEIVLTQFFSLSNEPNGNTLRELIKYRPCLTKMCTHERASRLVMTRASVLVDANKTLTDSNRSTNYVRIKRLRIGNHASNKSLKTYAVSRCNLWSWRIDNPCESESQGEWMKPKLSEGALELKVNLNINGINFHRFDLITLTEL